MHIQSCNVHYFTVRILIARIVALVGPQLYSVVQAGRISKVMLVRACGGVYF